MTYLVQWESTSGNLVEDFDWKTATELANSPRMVHKYTHEVMPLYSNVNSYYNNPVFSPSLDMFPPPNLCTLPKLVNENNNCWLNTLVFCLSQLALSNNWIAFYNAMPERALSPFWQRARHVVSAVLADPTQAFGAVRQLQQALATEAKQLGKLLLNNHRNYTGNEMVAIDWAIHVMQGGVNASPMEVGASAMDMLHWGIQLTPNLKCPTCLDQSRLLPKRCKILYLAQDRCAREELCQKILSTETIMGAHWLDLCAFVQGHTVPSQAAAAMKKATLCKRCSRYTPTELTPLHCDTQLGLHVVVQLHPTDIHHMLQERHSIDIRMGVPMSNPHLLLAHQYGFDNSAEGAMSDAPPSTTGHLTYRFHTMIFNKGGHYYSTTLCPLRKQWVLCDDLCTIFQLYPELQVQPLNIFHAHGRAGALCHLEQLPAEWPNVTSHMCPLAEAHNFSLVEVCTGGGATDPAWVKVRLVGVGARAEGHVPKSSLHLVPWIDRFNPHCIGSGTEEAHMIFEQELDCQPRAHTPEPTPKLHCQAPISMAVRAACDIAPKSEVVDFNGEDGQGGAPESNFTMRLRGIKLHRPQYGTPDTLLQAAGFRAVASSRACLATRPLMEVDHWHGRRWVAQQLQCFGSNNNCRHLMCETIVDSVETSPFEGLDIIVVWHPKLMRALLLAPGKLTLATEVGVCGYFSHVLQAMQHLCVAKSPPFDEADCCIAWQEATMQRNGHVGPTLQSLTSDEAMAALRKMPALHSGLSNNDISLTTPRAVERFIDLPIHHVDHNGLVSDTARTLELHGWVWPALQLHVWVPSTGNACACFPDLEQCARIVAAGQTGGLALVPVQATVHHGALVDDCPHLWCLQRWKVNVVWPKTKVGTQAVHLRDLGVFQVDEVRVQRWVGLGLFEMPGMQPESQTQWPAGRGKHRQTEPPQPNPEAMEVRFSVASFSGMGDYKLRSGFENALLFDSVPSQYYDPDYYPKLPPGRPVVIRLPLAGIPKGGKYYRWNEIFPNGHVYRAKHLAQPGSVRNVAAIPAGTSTVHVDGKGNVAPSAMGLHYPVAGGALCDWPAGDYRVLGWVAGCVGELVRIQPPQKCGTGAECEECSFANPAGERVVCTFSSDTWGSWESNRKNPAISTMTYSQQCVGPMLCLTPECPRAKVLSDRIDMHAATFFVKKGRWVCKSCSSQLLETAGASTGQSAVAQTQALTLVCNSKRFLEKPRLDPEHVYLYDENTHIAECTQRARAPLAEGQIKDILGRHPHFTASQVAHEMLNERDNMSKSILAHFAEGDMEGLRRCCRGIADNFDTRKFRYNVQKYKSQLASQDMGQVVALLKKQEAKNDWRFLWYYSIGQSPQKDEFDYVFLCSAANLGLPRNQRMPFTQVECLIQVLEEGRYFDVGLHVDDSHGKIRDWLVVAASTYDKDLGKMVDCAYMIARRWDGLKFVTQANRAMYKKFFDCILQVVRDYLGRPGFKVHISHLVTDQATEIKDGQRDSWVAHDPKFYKTDSLGNLLRCDTHAPAWAALPGQHCM